MTVPGKVDSAAAAPRRKARLPSADRRALIEKAACACMARGGIRAFTVDKVAAEAGVSRGLIAHHFGSMDGLLVAVYSRMYGEWIAAILVSRPGLGRLEAIVEALISPALFRRDVQNIWLTLWGEIANNPVLGAEHRMRYAEYRDGIAAALRESGSAVAGRDPEAVATALICLIDGLGVQRCVEPSLLPEASARAACWALLDPLRSSGTALPPPEPEGRTASPADAPEAVTRPDPAGPPVEPGSASRSATAARRCDRP
jgi:AcrR family transcriptional regulator